MGGAEWTSSMILWTTGGACGYGCVARVAIGHKKCKVMFNSDDLLDIGLGLPLLGDHLEKALGLL